MKKRFTEEQIIGFFRKADAAESVSLAACLSLRARLA